MKIDIIDEEDYFITDALNSSTLTFLEFLLKRNGNIDALSKVELKESEALVMGKIIDKLLQFPSLIHSIKAIDSKSNVGFEYYKEGTMNSRLLSFKAQHEALVNLYEKTRTEHYNTATGRWKQTRSDFQRTVCDEYVDYEKELSLLNIKAKNVKALEEEFGDYLQLQQEHKANTIVLLNEYDLKDPIKTMEKIQSMFDAICYNKEYNDLLKKPGVEIKYQWAMTFDYRGVLCKALPDVVIIDHNTKELHLIDLKTTGQSKFKTYREKKYFRQLAFYSIPLLEMYPDYNFNYYILQAMWFEDILGLGCACSFNRVSFIDIDTAFYGGLLVPDYYSQTCGSQWQATTRGEIPNVDPEDPRYKIIGINELVDAYNKRDTNEQILEKLEIYCD